jgi:dolichol-phosphate mannosyltransferase
VSAKEASTAVRAPAVRAPTLRAARLVALLRVPDPRRATRSDWAELVRFCLVGASGWVVNLAVYSTLFQMVGVHYMASAVGAFAVAWASNFIWNKYWTFQRHRLSPLRQAVRYLLVSLFALSLNLVALYMLVAAGVPEISAQAAAIVAVTPVSFLLNRRWSFR